MDILRTPAARMLERGATLTGLLLVAGACATTGSTFRSGVGDQYIERPPYYAGSVAVPAAPLGHLPIAYQRGATHAGMFDPAARPGTAVAALLTEMNAQLRDLGVSTPLADAGQRIPGTPPDVAFGCVPDASGECDREQRTDQNTRVRMRLAVGRPSTGWTAWTRQAMDEAGAEGTLVITLEVGQFWIQPRGWRNDKMVELGTGHAVRLPWLTSLEAPVSVLQLTGALVDRDGRAVRIGAEGLLARRTDLILSSLGVQRLISDDDVERLRTSRRDDLPGSPLVWEVALRNLVAQLTGNHEVALR
jgi:hypothetical protein